MSTQNISAIVCLCFEVSPGPFGYRVPHDSSQEIHHMSSKWNKMYQPQKKQKQNSNINTMIGKTKSYGKGNNSCKNATQLSIICYAVVNNQLPRFTIRQ